jgi:hypothetical protein
MRNVALRAGLMNTDDYEKMHRVYNIQLQQKRFDAWHVFISDCVKLNITASEFFK